MEIVKLSLAGLAAFSCSAADIDEPAENQPADAAAPVAEARNEPLPVPEPAPQAAEIAERCGIFSDRSADGLLLQAYADPGMNGEYRFDVWMNGPGGSADIVQSGAMEPSGSSVLGEINVDPSANWRAELTITGKNGATLCSARGGA